MTQVTDPMADIRFIRGAVDRAGHHRTPVPVSVLWAVYTLVGYVLLDVRPQASGVFFLVGGVIGGCLTGWFYRRAERAAGVVDRDSGRRWFLHGAGGFVLAVAAAAAMQVIYPDLRGLVGGQICVVLVGMIYYLAGVHSTGDSRYLLWAGPLVMAGGIFVGKVPHHGWSALGGMIALCILVPVLRRIREVR